MNKLLTLAATLTLLASLTGCGRTANNTLPMMPYYPVQNGGGQQIVGATPPNQANLGHNGSDLPGDVAQGQVGSIVGKVVNRSGRPLHNVEVFVESQPSIKTRSNKGEFTLLNVPAGSQTLVFKIAGQETKSNVSVVPNTAVPPEQNPVKIEGDVGQEAANFGNPNRQVASFKVDQDFLNQWQPKGLVVSQNTLYVSAVDTRTLSKKGTVIKMDATTGKSWKDLASKWLGLSHPLKQTARGMALNNANVLLVVDEKKDIFAVDPSTGKVTTTKAEGALDIASGGDKVYIYSHRGLESADSSGSSPQVVANLSPTGGIGADSKGNAFVPVSNSIHQIDAATGKATPVITSQLSNPSDVAIDNRNGDIYVLDGVEVKRFDANGQFIVAFGSGAQEPAAIAVDEAGQVYVADFGTSQLNSKVLKFEAAALGTANAVSAVDATAPAEATPTEPTPTETTEEEPAPAETAAD